MHVWIFGDLWCSVWLAVDVWMCTASILNLCAISLDRYVAVTRPVTYPSIMSMGRAKILIASVWVLSFVICFPPLLGWRGEEPIVNSTSRARVWSARNETVISTGRPLTPGGATILNVPTTLEPQYYPQCPWICELTDETGYVIYSALGSFYLPMLVMLFFYWRIYRAAVQTTRAINQGFRTTKGTRAIGNRFDEQRLTLRIHRGRGSVMQGSSGSNSTTTTNSTANSVNNSPGGGKSPDTRVHRASNRRSEKGASRTHEKIKISVSYPSSDAISSVANNNTSPPGGSVNSKSGSFSSSSPTSSGPQYAVHYQNSNTNTLFRSSDANCHLRVTGARLATSHRRGRRSSTSPDSTSSRPRLLGESLNSSINKDLSPSPTFDESNQNAKPKLISRMGKRNIKAQVKRFRMETKAAKTLGIIVGGFIFCWLPFFTMYLFRAFCSECINDVAFSIMFWLGYCNSAINPCIYALFSKDFRFAFKRIICRCFCSSKQTRRESRYQRRGSDGSHLGVRRCERDRSSSCNNNDAPANATHHSLGEDSEGNNEGTSDSR
ncbi:G-protein coupled receptor activity protein [Homalodisca vitripennis]|nr:G-protein coupled receptor activity protein [Homalodisca vitripennis]